MASSAGQPAPERPRDPGLTWPVLVAVALALLLLPLAPGLRTLLHLRALAPYWALARAGGLLAYLCLWLAVLSGVILHLKLRLPAWLQPLLVDLHQFGAAWAAYVGLFHGLILLFDRYVGFRWADILLPFAGRYKPALTSAGILAFYGLLLVLLTTYLRAWLSSQAWHRLHLVSYPAYLLGLLHGILLGTDSALPWVRCLYLVTGTLLAVPLLVRAGLSLLPAGKSP